VKRFKWTRAKYRRAESLARFFGRHIYELPEQPPEQLRRYFELWERHPQSLDPLLIPMRARVRYNRGDIPF
jgi:hypothetical protein